MNLLWPTADSLNERVTPHQREQYARATSGRVGVFAGNPGAGKSTVVAWAIEQAIKQFGPEEIAVCAFMGKAAVRLNARFDELGLPIQATTIHRTLGVCRNGHDGNGWGFMFNAYKPLPKRFVFVDEFSTVGCTLLSNLVAACAPGTHILFAGDTGQLPPVEHGAPMRDLVDAGVPYGELVEVHRNSGDVGRVAEDLKQGRPYRPSRWVDLERIGDDGKPDPANVGHIECRDAASQKAELRRLLNGVPSGIDPVWDIQVLCAVNDGTEVCRNALNEGLQRILNPGGERVDKLEFALSDKVICTSNGFLPVLKCINCGCDHASQVKFDASDGTYACEKCGYGWEPKIMPGDFVANGEIGRVTLVKPRLMHVAIEAPRRTVRVSGEYLRDWQLAYAITVHKSQGSQAPIVIPMIDDSRNADRVTSWQWHRTGITRMEWLVQTIGKQEAIRRQCRCDALAARKTFLCEKLKAATGKVVA